MPTYEVRAQFTLSVPGLLRSCPSEAIILVSWTLGWRVAGSAPHLPVGAKPSSPVLLPTIVAILVLFVDAAR